MASSLTEGTPAQLRPVRIIYREITGGDRRKIVAESNNADTGGGARDFRFNHENFGPVFAKMFRERRMEERRRDGQRTEVEVYVGQLCWYVNPAQPAEVMSTEIVYEPPTSVRPAEGRIARVHEYEPFSRYPDEADRYPDEAEGMVFLLLVEDESGCVWPFFATESSLRGKGWNKDVAPKILDCIEKTRDHQAVLGWIDLTVPSSYCHGDKRVSSAR